MNKPFYIIIFLLLFCCEAKTQTEYITNGGFEQIDSCYGCTSAIGFDVFQWTGCKGWSIPISSSSDLWCNGGIQCSVNPPNIVGIGYQFPRTGNNMAGILLGDNGYANYREYIQNKLMLSLTQNRNYLVEFYMSKAYMPCTTNKIGIKFFDSKYSDMSTYWLTNLQPDAENETTNFITDTLGWQKVSMEYKANGNEKYIVIGSFADSLNLTLEPNGCDTSGIGVSYVLGVGYFFIDDVSIKEIEPLAPIIPNVFTPNSDLLNDIWRCDFSTFENVSCFIYNRWGNLIYQSNKQIILWDGTTTSGNNCEDGVYFYCIETEKEKYKGHIQLIR